MNVHVSTALMLTFKVRMAVCFYSKSHVKAITLNGSFFDNTTDLSEHSPPQTTPTSAGGSPGYVTNMCILPEVGIQTKLA